MEIATVLPLLWLLFAIVAALIGSPKGRGGLGFILGLLFGPFGILIMLFTKSSRREGASEKAMKSDLKKFSQGTRGYKVHHNIKAFLVVIGLFIGIGLLASIFSGPSHRQVVRTSPETVRKSKPAISDADIPEPVSTYKLKLLSWSWRQTASGDYVKAEGQIKNISGKSLRSVAALVTFYDKDGNFITAHESLIDYNPILPGQKSPFSVLERYNPAIKTATVEFKYLFGGAILTQQK